MLTTILIPLMKLLFMESTACDAAILSQYLTKPKHFPFPLRLEVGMKLSATLPNDEKTFLSFSTEMDSGRLSTKTEMRSSHRATLFSLRLLLSTEMQVLSSQTISSQKSRLFINSGTRLLDHSWVEEISNASVISFSAMFKWVPCLTSPCS